MKKQMIGRSWSKRNTIEKTNDEYHITIYYDLNYVFEKFLNYKGAAEKNMKQTRAYWIEYENKQVRVNSTKIVKN